MRISDWSSDVCSSDLIEPPKNTSLEFAGVVSSLYYNQRDFKDIGMKKAWYFEEFLRNRYQEDSESPHQDPEFIARLAAKSGIDKQNLEELFHSIVYTRAADFISEEELHSLNKQIEDFLRLGAGT